MNSCLAGAEIESEKQSAGKEELPLEQERRLTGARGAWVAYSLLPKSEWLAPPRSKSGNLVDGLQRESYSRELLENQKMNSSHAK